MFAIRINKSVAHPAGHPYASDFEERILIRGQFLEPKPKPKAKAKAKAQQRRQLASGSDVARGSSGGEGGKVGRRRSSVSTEVTRRDQYVDGRGLCKIRFPLGRGGGGGGSDGGDDADGGGGGGGGGFQHLLALQASQQKEKKKRRKKPKQGGGDGDGDGDGDCELTRFKAALIADLTPILQVHRSRVRVEKLTLTATPRSGSGSVVAHVWIAQRGAYDPL
jgi:hypothetical protein